MRRHSLVLQKPMILSLRFLKAEKYRSVRLRKDGSGEASAFIGRGKTLQAPKVPVPDLIENMKENDGYGYENGRASIQIQSVKK